jgi:RNA polymerase sigma-70 factor (ECF subfamily)
MTEINAKGQIMTSRVDDLLNANTDDDILIIETLVDEFHGYIYRLSYSILQDHASVEDAVQETFITAFLKLEQYESGTNLKAWLSTIAVNICRNHIRKQKRQEVRQTVWHAIRELTGPVSNPEEETARGETNSSLWGAVNSLGDKHRMPMVLRYVHGLPVRQIADILEIKPGTVHSRLHYGIKKLRSALEQENFAVKDVWEVIP